jgi:two-component system LytT family response regulator
MSKKLSLKAVVIDDSEQARKLLRLMLQELELDIQFVGEAENVDDGLQLIHSTSPDVVFLDIEMPGKSGLHLAEILITEKIPTQVVFTTAYNSYAINAFRLSAIDYLLKPINEDQLEEAVEKVKHNKQLIDSNKRLEILTNNLKEGNSPVLSIPVQGGYDFIPLDDIIYLEADGSYVKIVCTEKRNKLVSKNLKYFEGMLESASHFIRPHRSFLVNMKHVLSFNKTDGGSLTVDINQNIPISRERKQEVVEYLNKTK